jgi:predicted phosphodiesterase
MIRAWSEDEDRQLLNLVNKEGLTTEEIARKMGRSYKSIQHRRANLTRGNNTDTVELRSLTKKEKPLNSKQISQVLISTLKEELSELSSFPPIKSKTEIKGDTLVIHLTDLHAGKLVKNQEDAIIYNEEIFESRMNTLCEQILKLLDHNISKGVPITDVVILASGDLCNGEGIYATQAFEQEYAPPRQVMTVVEILRKLIVSLLKRKLSVTFYGIRGNHGRTGKDTDVVSNWDIMVYMILDFWARTSLKNPKFQIKYAETEYIVFNIRGHGFLMRHIAPEQVDSPAGRVKINEWARQHNVEAVVYGHYHHAAVSDCDNVRVIRGGSTVGGDSLSDSMAKHSEPIQLIFGVNEKRVTTFIYFVDLNKNKDR